MGTHEQGIAIAEAFAEEHGIPWNRLRWVAAGHLEQQMRDWLGDDHGHGIGSSDVSCHLSSLARLGELEPLCDGLKLIARVARSSNKTFEEAEEGMRLLLAPR